MAGRPPLRRVLLVTNWIGWAGAETQLNYLALGLREAGHEVTLLGICEITSDVRELERAGVELVALGAVSRMSKLRSLPRLARHARKADLVHCTGWDATLWGRLAAAVARRPVVITEHTPGRELQVNARGASRARQIALHNKLLDRFTAATIAVGAWQKELLEREGVRPEAIVRIPNAVPIEELRQRAHGGPPRADLGLPEGAPVVLQVARFAAQKGQPIALRAVARLRERLGDVRLLFVGEGTTEAEVRREAERAGASWASFLGFRDDVAGLLALADLVVLPSSGEGLPMSLIEAIAIGTPVVATDVGDVGWLLESTGGGICVPVGDEDAFGEACARMLEDDELRARTEEAAERAAGELDAAKMVRRYERVFEAAIAGAPLAGLEA